MLKFVFIFMLFSFVPVSAQRVSGRANVEALENINVSLERIENAITTLTSQSEETAYNQKNSKAEADSILKDIKLQISELRVEQEKLSKELYAQKIETQNLNNIVAMLREKLDESEKVKEAEKKAEKDPEPLLVKTVVEEEKVVKEEKPSDDKSFDLAMAVFDKKDFTESAIKFAANLKNFPEGKNFHKNLLYLGLSMKELENKNGACTAFAKIVNSKEDIEKNLVDRAVVEFDIMKCNPKVEEAKKENNANK